MMELIKKICFVFVPFLALLYVLYRAVWVLAGYGYAKPKYTTNNIGVLTGWKPIGTQSQLITYGGCANGFTAWVSGLKKIYLLPVVLLTPGFYGGLLHPTQYENFN